MCGRFSQGFSETHYTVTLAPEWTQGNLGLQPSWNVSPGREGLVLHDGDGGHVAELMHWGFLPSWADAEATKYINARVETAAQKPYFRDAWKSGRCLIPADGWYQWKETPKGKQPYFIHRVDDEPALMAGLFDTNRQTNITAFVILTMEAEDPLRGLHDREPVVLSAEAGRRWIARDTPLAEIAAIAQHPLASDAFAWHPVSTRVSNVKNDGADLIARIL